jgi:sulfur carrier protein
MKQIVVNGEKIEIQSATVLEFLTKEKKLLPDHMVIELNGNILKKDFWDKTGLENGDHLELVHFVGGG